MYLRVFVAVMALMLVPVASADCPLATTSPTVTICTPTNGTTVTSPFAVSASANDTAHPVTAMKAYLDFNSTAVAVSSTNQLSATLSAASGSHHLTVNAWDSSGTVFKTSVDFTVGAAPPPPGTVTLSPASLSFGAVVVGVTSSPQTATLSNGTAASVAITSITASPADFAASSNCGSSLAAGSSCQIRVTFTPGSAAAESGSLTITDDSGTQTAALSGKGVTVSSLSVSPANPTIGVGSMQQFAATATFNDSSTGDITDLATWTSSDTTVATIDSSGLATAVATGTSTIQATYGSSSDSTVLTATAASSFAGVLTFHNDNMRTGANTRETILTPSNVNVTSFGKKKSYSVDGRIYAQPLYVPGISVLNQVTGLAESHDVVFVATEHDSVYAFDGDGDASSYFWKKSLVPAGATTIPASNLGGSAIPISPEIGITGTPVIDAASGTLYVVAGSRDSTGVYRWMLHALSIHTGAEKFGGPVLVQSTGFIAKWQLQRPALLLADGVVYFGFASEGDQSTWHGWVFAYDASTLLKVFAYNDTPGGNGGGIWQSAGGLAADKDANGNVQIYFETGNGTYGVTGGNLSDSFVKLSASGAVLDFFTPFNHSSLDCCDKDLSGGGPVLLPDQGGPSPHVMVGGGKAGTIYVIDRDNLGMVNSTSNNIIQTINGAVGPIFSQPSYWNGKLYIVASADVPKAFSVSNGLLSTSAVSKNSHSFRFPGANTSISANGTGNGILWAQEYFGTSAGILHAYKASGLSTELWNSNMNATRDSMGSADKFMAPTIANGRVYIGTRSKTLVIYGLLP